MSTSTTTDTNAINGYNEFGFGFTNARSIIPKIDSLVNYFDEHKLTFVMITETWLKKNNDVASARPRRPRVGGQYRID